jgi:hypothetical protein
VHLVCESKVHYGSVQQTGGSPCARKPNRNR